MGTDYITNILKISLIISVILLFVLMVAFIILELKRKNEKKEDEELIEIKSKEDKKTSNTTQAKIFTTKDIKDFMDFDEIKDNMIIQKNGKRLVMVIQCQGINYDLMSSIEKVGVEQGFVQFLNTLTRPIQIYIQSRKVNLEESIENYKKKLKTIESNYGKARFQYDEAAKNNNINPDKFKNIKFEYIRQKNLYEYTKDIISNTETMSLNKNILTKKYYIAISYYPENPDELFKKEEIIDLAFSELYTTAQSILRALAMCDVSGRVLDSLELADLLYVAYNRDSSEIFGVDKAISAGYDSLYTTAPDVLDKKIEALNKMINEKSMILANDTIEKVTLNNQKKKEIELKEKNLENLIKEMAQSIIEENKGYIPEEIVEESIKEIEKSKETKSKSTKKTKGTTKKGA